MMAIQLSSAALPPDQPPSHQQDNPELPPQGQAQIDKEEEEIQEAQHDQEEMEHLPDHTGGSGSSESEAEADGEADDEINNIDEEEGGDEMGTAAGSSNKRMKQSESDPNGRMLGQLNSEAPPLDYQGKKAAAIAHIKTLVGQEVIQKHKNKSVK